MRQSSLAVLSSLRYSEGEGRNRFVAKRIETSFRWRVLTLAFAELVYLIRLPVPAGPSMKICVGTPSSIEV
jgi:hypothetical protein